MRRSVQDLFAVLVKVRTRRAAFTVRDHLHVRTIRVHRVYLIAASSVTLRLKDQLLSIRREIRLCVLAAERQLLYIFEVSFGRLLSADICK